MNIDPASLFGKAVENLKTVLLPEDPPNDGRGYARAHNFLFDERVGDKRLQDYLQELALAAATARDLVVRHTRYYNNRIQTPAIPPTFLIGNELAFIDLDDETILVKVENITELLDSFVRPDRPDRKSVYDILKNSIQDHNDKNQSTTDFKNAKAFLEDWLKAWNFKRDSRPVFAALEEDVRDVMAQTDWEEALRTRLGLAHMNPKNDNLYIALMRYSVKDVRRAFENMRDAGVLSAFAAPTVLDGRIWEYFFPAPVPNQQMLATCGRAMPLESLLISVRELLHIKMNYHLEHFCKLGVLTNPISDHSVRQLRNDHLVHLRIETGLMTFGEEIPN
ncbi:MAG: hypothetical protein H7839_15115 [Magnetococcus sp. YQC-5]